MRLATFTPWLWAGVAMLTAQSALASTVQMSVTGQFSDVVAEPHADYRTGITPDAKRATLKWRVDHSGTSRVRFYGFRIPGQGNQSFSELGSPFALGKLLFNNHGACGLPGISSASMTLSFLWGDDATSAVDIQYGLSLTEQTITSPSGRRTLQGDLLTLNAPTSSFLFDTDAGQYRLDLLGWSNDGGQSFVDSLFVADHRRRKLKLYATLEAVTSLPPPDPQAVPVPAAVWLFGSGLAALTGLARRR